MFGKIKHLYQISHFHPLSIKSMLNLEESRPCESLGPGSISKINNIDMGEQGEDQFACPKKSRFSKQIPKIFRPRLQHLDQREQIRSNSK